MSQRAAKHCSAQ